VNTARRHLLALLGILAALVASTATRPAFAHHGGGGPVRIYLESVRLEPRAEEWVVRASLNDTGSGKPAPGYLVQVSGAGPQGATFGPVSLADDDADGRYDGSLGRMAPGEWSVTVDVGDAPGGDGYIIPINRTWPVRLHARQALDLIEEGSSSSGAARSSRSGTDFTSILPVAGIAVLLGASAAWLSRRKRAILRAR
jgi:LPXTG-motif cell wall-anchored protein